MSPPHTGPVLKGHLHQVRQHVLGVQGDPAQVSVLLDEVEELGRVGHPESKRPCDVLLFLGAERIP